MCGSPTRSIVQNAWRREMQVLHDLSILRDTRKGIPITCGVFESGGHCLTTWRNNGIGMVVLLLD
jgi:hypothetical protein